MDQRIKVHGDGVRRQVFFQYCGLDVRTIRSDHTRRPNAETQRDPIDILFYHIETGQEFAVAGNSPFYGRQLTYMGVAKILVT